MAKFNFYFGATMSAWLLAILVIVAELAEPFKNFLKTIFTHHWIGKAAIVILAFLIFGFLLKDKGSIGKVSDDKLAWFSAIGSLTIIFLFFVIEFLK